MSALLPVAPKLAILIPRLASNHDGEVLATVAAIRRTLAGHKLDLHDLAAAIGLGEAPPSEPQSWHELAVWCRYHGIATLSARESGFVDDMCDRLVFGGEPTERQGAWLRSIYAKLRRQAA